MSRPVWWWRRRARVAVARFVQLPLADALRATVRCAFPLGSLALWAVLIFCGQGQDVLRRIIESCKLYEVGDAVWLGFAACLLGLSIWYSMRWMLTVSLAALLFRRAQPGFVRRNAPRWAGAAVPGAVALCAYFLRIANDAQAARLWVVAAFAGLSGILLLFFWVRRMLIDMQGTLGRQANGSPGSLPLGMPLPTLPRGVLVWSFVPLAMLSLLFMAVPLLAPRAIGSAAAPALAIAATNLFGTFVLTYLPLKHAVPPLVPAVAIAAALLSYCNDNHTLRDAVDVRPGATPAPRSDLRSAFAAWLAAQHVQPASQATPRRVPIVLVASEGGGIRAAYWTAAVLDELQSQGPAGTPVFEPDRYLFALSGVSGGSVGLASWLASVRPTLCKPPGAPPPPPFKAAHALGQDFLAPALAGLFYYDFFQRFLPWPVPGFDRSRGLEEGWQRAHERISGSPFSNSMGALYAGCPQLPLLLLNTTVVESGQRGIMAPITTTDWARDAVDLMDAQWTTATQPLSGLVHHSARFPIISPPGSVELQVERGDDRDSYVRRHQPLTRKRLVDGGYYDNSGVQTVLDLLIALRRAGTVPAGLELQPILVAITNGGGAGQPCDDDPAKRAPPPAPQAAPGVSRFVYDATSPFVALLNVRDSHTRVMMAEARERFGAGNVIEIPMPRNIGGADPALGWSLSTYATSYMSRVAKCAVREALPAVRAAACVNGACERAPGP
ncbi:hypothetical protein [Variovorax guangxiensis]|uniref:hypothetical protein n=1 Tax=Variovorax guangxiensis TaxID=1775474 RepID=UPI00285B8C3C|nr:hypothetical protein [Variovorax guangxiensis]MDR6860508.1 hypothetical protein [Variovorax guangxiensis]